jgi:hypothetical protein
MPDEPLISLLQLRTPKDLAIGAVQEYSFLHDQPKHGCHAQKRRAVDVMGLL